MAGVIGIGGIFIKFKEPQKMRQWYSEVLGMTTNDYGVLFEFNGNTSTTKGFLQLGTFDDKSDYFGAQEQRYMLNFRVDNLTEMLAQLKKAGVAIVNEIQEYSYGKFLHIEDPEGNRIELWEPVDIEFEQGSDARMPMR